VGAAILWISAALVRWGAESTPAVEPGPTPRRGAGWRGILVVCALALGASVQVLFLTSVLPQVLPVLGVAPHDTLVVGGLLVFTSGVAAALGSLLAPRLARGLGERSVMAWLLIASSVLLAGLAPLRSVWTFGAVRFLQVLCVAPVFPIAFAAIAPHAGGEAIGVVNSARIAATFVGPVVATTVLSSASPAVLYVVLALMGLACVPVAFRHRVERNRARP
jgi:MFS family permease